MEAYTPIADNIALAEKAQYYSSNDIARFEKFSGVSSNLNHPMLVRMVRTSLEWGRSQGSTLTVGVDGEGDFSDIDFSSGDFVVSGTGTLSEVIEFDGIDLISNYLYALCGSYTNRVNVINGVFAIQFNNTFN